MEGGGGRREGGEDGRVSSVLLFDDDAVVIVGCHETVAFYRSWAEWSDCTCSGPLNWRSSDDRSSPSFS